MDDLDLEDLYGSEYDNEESMDSDELADRIM